MWAAYQGESDTSFGPECSELTEGDAISVDLLLRHGASTSARDNSQMTPLHWAAVKGSAACIRHLLDHGADLDAREASGKSPRDMAEELKGSVPFNKGLTDAGYSTTGLKKYGRLSEVSSDVLMPSLQDSSR
jgi:palmitoyltransferase